jgi:predicted phage terminase large subunit-like protein
MQISKSFRDSAVREYCSRKFYNFFKYFWKQVEVSDFEDNWHIELVCNELQKRFELYTNNEQNEELLRDLIFNLPPGCSKSLMISVFFPAWVWLIKPSTKIISYSYSYKVAEELSGKSLRLLMSDEYQSICDFKLTSTAISNIKNNKYGQRFVTSTGGAVTGIHADIIIGDDPNSPQSINSEASREEAKRFVREILPSRKTSIKRSYCITVQQRMHNEDVTSCLLDLGNPKLVAVSAINENGESFFPSRFPLSVLNNKKIELGSISFMAQYMQITQDEQGGILKKDWLRIEPTQHKPLIYFIDSAYGGVKADDNAVLGCYKEANNLIIQSVERNKLEFPELLKWLKSNIPNNSKVYIEGKASGKSIIQTLKQETSFNIIEVQPKGSKLERKHSCAPYFEAGRVIINSSIKYKQDLIEQLVFDNTKHDDIMDVVTMAVDNILKVNKGVYNVL